MKTLESFDFTGKRVLLRCDLNVPIKEGVIGDDGRIRASLPTIQYLLSQGASVVITAHLGRPKGERKPELSLAEVVAKYPQCPRLIALKIDVQRRGVHYTDKALAAVDYSIHQMRSPYLFGSRDGQIKDLPESHPARLRARSELCHCGCGRTTDTVAHNHAFVRD